MLTKIKSGLLVLLLAVSVCAFSALSWALVSVSVTAEQGRVTLVHLDQAVQDADEALAAIRLQESEAARQLLGQGGILDRFEDEQNQIRDVTRASRVTVDEAGLAAIQQRHFWGEELPILTGQLSNTIVDAQKSILAVRPVLAQAKTTLAGMAPVTQQAAQVTHDLDTRINSPQVTAMLNAGQKAAEQSAEAAAHTNQITADSAAELHGFLHPQWPGKAWRGFKTHVLRQKAAK